MKFTLIVEDATVGIDGEFRKVTLPNLSSVRAVQFNHGTGHIEFNNAANQLINNLDQFAHIIQLWQEAAPTAPEPPTLNALKLQKIATINQIRGDKNSSTFHFMGKLIACDQLSRSDVDAVAGFISLNGTLPQAFPGAWKATDNTYLPMPDIAAFKAMYAAMVAEGSANFMHSEQLKLLVAVATTAQELEAIQW